MILVILLNNHGQVCTTVQHNRKNNAARCAPLPLDNLGDPDDAAAATTTESDLRLPILALLLPRMPKMAKTTTTTTGEAWRLWALESTRAPAGCDDDGLDADGENDRGHGDGAEGGRGREVTRTGEPARTAGRRRRQRRPPVGVGLCSAERQPRRRRSH